MAHVALSARNTIHVLQPLDPPVLPNPPALADQIISEIASATLKEFIISMSLSAFTCLFIATTGGAIVLLAGTITMVAINAIIRGAIGYATLRSGELQRDGSQEALDLRASYETLIRYANYLCPLNFSRIDITTRNTLIHEGGHALAAMALYEGAHPQITVFPFEGGVTEIIPEQLSALGQKVGAENAHIITAAAGSGLAVLFATLNLAIGHAVSESHPELSRYLEVTGISSIIQHVIYALSALMGACDDGHDFYFLWQTGGIHPLISVAIMVLTPLLAKTILYAIDEIRACSIAPSPQPLIQAAPDQLLGLFRSKSLFL